MRQYDRLRCNHFRLDVPDIVIFGGGHAGTYSTVKCEGPSGRVDWQLGRGQLLQYIFLPKGEAAQDAEIKVNLVLKRHVPGLPSGVRVPKAGLLGQQDEACQVIRGLPTALARPALNPWAFGQIAALDILQVPEESLSHIGWLLATVLAATEEFLG